MKKILKYRVKDATKFRYRASHHVLEAMDFLLTWWV